MHSLIYVSNACFPAGGEDDFSILSESVAFNRRGGIGGYLLRTPHQFFQILEGPEDRLNLLMDKICRDPRHSDVRILSHNATGSACFAGWSMGFKLLRALSNPIFAPRDAYSDQETAELIHAIRALAELENTLTGPPSPRLN